MNMTIVREDNELTEISLTGSLDTQGVAEIEAKFHSHAENRKLSVIVDISGVAFIMSRGITMLAQCAAVLQKFGKKMVLVNPQLNVSEVLKNVALDKIIPTAQSLAEAEEILRK